jgi:hypothetical protein
MKRIKQLLTVACLLLAFSATAAQQSELFTLYTQYTPGALPASGAAFTDDFNRADAATLGANWTVLSGTISNQVNKASSATLDYTNMAVVYVTNTGSVNQYAKITIDGTSRAGRGIYPKIIFRANGTNEHYNLTFHVNENLVKWNYMTNAAGNSTLIASAALTIEETNTFGATIIGTGTTTILRVWREPTNLATAMDNWDGDATPDVSFTDDPAVACDSGLQVGFGGAASDAADLRWEDFAGGDIP